MIIRIKAIRSTLGLMLTAIQLVIGFGLLAKAISIDEGVGRIWDNINDFGNSSGNYHSMAFNNVEMYRSFAFLSVVLVFMVFSYLMFFMMPGMVEKKERKMEWDYD